MLEQLRRTLVESYIGAIALGWLLADTIMAVPRLFTVPFQNWMMMMNRQQPVSVFDEGGRHAISFPLQAAIPDLVRIIFLMLVFFLLLRWLYFKPLTMGYSRTSAGIRARRVHAGGLRRVRLPHES